MVGFVAIFAMNPCKNGSSKVRITFELWISTIRENSDSKKDLFSPLDKTSKFGSPTAITFKFVCSIFTSLCFFVECKLQTRKFFATLKDIFLLLLIYMDHVADFETWQSLYVEFFIQIICVRENNTYQLLQVLRQLKIFMTWRIKMFLLKKFELTKYHLLKRRTRTPVWQKKQFVMWENKKNDVRNTPPETIRNEKKTQKRKRNKTQKMPTAVLRGDSQSGSAANAPIRSALSWPFYLSWSKFVLVGAWPRSFAPRLYKSSTRQSAIWSFLLNKSGHFVIVFLRIRGGWIKVSDVRLSAPRSGALVPKTSARLGCNRWFLSMG